MDTEAGRINAAALLLAGGMPTQAALVCGALRISYAELRQAVAQAAAAWQDCGVAPGEVVLLRIPRGIEQAVAFLGAIWAGAVPVPLGSGGAGHLGHLWDRQAPGRFILDTTRAGYVGPWRDSVLTLPEWCAYVAESGRAEPLELPPAAPACWTEPRRADGTGARLLTHAFAAARGPQPPSVRAGTVAQAGTTLAMLRVLRRCGTALITTAPSPVLRSGVRTAEPALP